MGNRQNLFLFHHIGAIPQITNGNPLLENTGVYCAGNTQKRPTSSLTNMQGMHRIETGILGISRTRGFRHTKVRSNNLYIQSSHLHPLGHPLAILLWITSVSRVLRHPQVRILPQVTPCRHLHRLALTKLRNAGTDTQSTSHTRNTGGVVLGAKRTMILASAKMLLGAGVAIRTQSQMQIIGGYPMSTGSGKNLAPRL